MQLLKELMMITEGKTNKPLTIPQTKPRGKQVHDVLRSKKGGRMKSASDYDRNAVKRDTRNALSEAEEGYFWYDVSWERKNHGGSGPEETLHHDDGVLKAGTKEEAIAKVKKSYENSGYNLQVRVGAATKAEFDNHMRD